MRFTYFYKSADGIRHEDKIDAPSREEAFVLLRERGIRAIKVVSDCGSKANGEVKFVTRKRVVFAALAAGIVAGVAIMLTKPSIPIDLRDKRVISLDNSSQAVMSDHRTRMAAAKVAQLTEYALMADAQNDAAMRHAISAGYTELNRTRGKLRDLFRIIYETLPEDKERADANRLYAAAIDALDLEEARLARSEKGFEFLVTHRGEWESEGGRVVFSDPALQAEFSSYRSEL